MTFDWGNFGRATALAAAGLIVLGAAAGAQGNRMTGLKLSGDQPIQIESDKLEVKQNENIAIFTGNVNVVQGATNLKSGRMVVHYASGDSADKGGSTGSASTEGGSSPAASSEIERIEVSEKVYVKSDNQIATGDEGSFNMKTEELVLTGKEVVLNDGDNVVVGCKLVVQMATGEAQLDPCQGGRVQMLLKPQQRN